MEAVREFEQVGAAPDMTGAVLDELIAQEVSDRNGPPELSVIWLQVSGQWWRVFTEGPTLHWHAAWPDPFQSWETEEYRFTFRDLGTELDVRGQRLAGCVRGHDQESPLVSIQLQDGRTMTFFRNGRTADSIEVVRWVEFF